MPSKEGLITQQAEIQAFLNCGIVQSNVCLSFFEEDYHSNDIDSLSSAHSLAHSKHSL